MKLKKGLIALCIMSLSILCVPIWSMADDDIQNPVMNFAGTYVCQRARLDVNPADSEQGAEITVTWADSAFKHAEWTMSGDLDTETLTISYSDCTKKTVEFDGEGNVAEENIEYTDGTGTITFNEDNTLTWNDEVENIAKDSVFEYTVIVQFDSIFSENASQTDKYIMYVGTNDKDTYEPVMPFEEARDLANSICAKYTSGFTQIDAKGGWLDESGELTQEDTLIYCFFDATEDQMKNIMNELIEQLHQSSILIEKQQPVYTFYTGE